MLQRKGMWKIGSLAAGAAFAAMTTPALAQAKPEPLVVLRGPGLKQVFTAPADEGLARAMAMLTQRLKEIPTEVRTHAGPDRQLQEGMAMLSTVMPLVAGMIDHPCELAVIDHGGMAGMLPDIDVRLIVQTGSKQATSQMFGAMRYLAQMASEKEGFQLAPEAGSNRMTLALPMGRFVFGPLDADETRFLAGFDSAGNGLDTQPLTIPGPAELAGANLDAQLYVNVKSITGLATRVMSAHGHPAAPQVSHMISQFMPEGDLDLIAASAIRGDRRWTVIRARGAITVLENVAQTFQAFIGEINFHPPALGAEVFRLIPHDVTLAGAQVQDLSSLTAPLQMVAFQAGVPALVPVIESIGKTWVSYMSEETGGGGLTSLVMIQPDVDAAEMDAALDGLVVAANTHAAPLHGYVRARTWQAKAERGDAVKVHSLAFPGLPVPLELSLGVVDGRLVMAVTPQGLLAAVDHWRSGRLSLADNPRFKDASAGLLNGAGKVSFIDMPRTLTRGYPVAQMLGSAAANFVRSPSDPARDPGVVTPSLRALSRDAKAWISVSRIDGGDYVFISSGDPSVMVNVAGGAGAMGFTPAIIGAAAAAVGIAQEHHAPMNAIDF